MEIAIAIYDGVTALDAVGPYEPLSRMPGATTKFVAAEAGAPEQIVELVRALATGADNA